jgi:hypothetical protein
MKNRCFSSQLLWFILTPFVLMQARCDDPSQYIPYVPVDFEINVDLPSYIDLSVPSGHLLVSGGSQGIILYRYTLDQFVALDRHATADIEAACQVQIAEDGLMLLDPCSDAQWLIIDGSVVSGDVSLPLHKYATTWNPPILRVYNP